MKDIGLDQEIFTQKIYRKAAVGVNASDFRRREKDELRAFLHEKGLSCNGIGQIQFRMGPHDEVFEPSGFQRTQNRGPSKPPVSGNIDTAIRMHVHVRL